MNSKEEKLIREYVRMKINHSLNEHKEQQRQIIQEELRLRKVIRQILKEGDISDMHPHRSTGINVLEDVLKKMITTLRTDYKRMTTSKQQRDCFPVTIGSVSNSGVSGASNSGVGSAIKVSVPCK